MINNWCFYLFVILFPVSTHCTCSIYLNPSIIPFTPGWCMLTNFSVNMLSRIRPTFSKQASLAPSASGRTNQRASWILINIQTEWWVGCGYKHCIIMWWLLQWLAKLPWEVPCFSCFLAGVNQGWKPRVTYDLVIVTIGNQEWKCLWPWLCLPGQRESPRMERGIRV